jgi:hypothetical protein
MCPQRVRSAKTGVAQEKSGLKIEGVTRSTLACNLKHPFCGEGPERNSMKQMRYYVTEIGSHD